MAPQQWDRIKQSYYRLVMEDKVWRLAGVALLVVVVVIGAGWPLSGRSPISFGLPQPTSTPQPTPLPTPAPTTVIQAEPTSTSSNPVTVVSVKPKPAEKLATPETHQAAVELPRRLTIPSIGVDAGFEYVGLTADGAMGVPADPAKVAWYSLGPRPGETGNAVVAGHVDWGGKLQVFGMLREVKPGDAVSVTAADGKTYAFVVTSTRWFDATPSAAEVKDVFGQMSGSELTLITCGGEFDSKTRQYLSRLVVRAELR